MLKVFLNCRVYLIHSTICIYRTRKSVGLV